MKLFTTNPLFSTISYCKENDVKRMESLHLPKVWIENHKNSKGLWIPVQEYYWTEDKFFLVFKCLNKELLFDIRYKTGGSFYDLSLEDQCYILKISLNDVKVSSTKKDDKKIWIFEENKFQSVEDMGLYYFNQLGWEGLNNEGHAAGMITHIISKGMQNETGEPLHGYLKTHRAWANKKEHFRIVEKFLNDRVNFNWISSVFHATPNYYFSLNRKKPVEPRVLEYLWEGVGKDFFKKIILLQIKNSVPGDLTCGALSGWSDLTLWKDNKIKFVEVKSKDKLHRNQAYWIRNYSKSLDLDFSIIRFKSENNKSTSL